MAIAEGSDTSTQVNDVEAPLPIPPAAAANPPSLASGPEASAPPDRSAANEPLVAQPAGTLFSLLLQQLVAPPAVAQASLPSEDVSAERQMPSADGKLLPPPAAAEGLVAAWLDLPPPAMAQGIPAPAEALGPPDTPAGREVAAAAPAGVLTHGALVTAALSAELVPGAAATDVLEGLTRRQDIPGGLANATLALAAASPARGGDQAAQGLPAGVADRPDAAALAAAGVNAVAADSASAPMPSASQATANTAALAPNTSGWGEALGERVLWLIGNRVSAAQLSLNPPELGPLEVRILLDGDQAQLHFVSAHAHVREALEGALPRLREMLGEAGIQLLDAGVHDAWSGMSRSTPAEAELAFGTEGDEPSVPVEPAPRIRMTEGLLDLYA